MFGKKAQTATEYLIILAVVIVVALIVVGVMGGIPGIGKGVGAKALASYWKSADLAVDSFVQEDATTGNAYTVILRNNLDTTVTLSTFTVGGDDMLGGGTSTLSPGQSKTYTFAGPTTGCTAGDAVTRQVVMTYTDSATGAAYTMDSSTGDVPQLDTTCAN